MNLSRRRREELVEEWRGSGLSAKEFAARSGLNANTLAHWKWQFGNEEKASRPAEARFIEVKVAPAPAPKEAKAAIATGESKSSFGLTLLERGIKVEVPETFDAQALQRLLRALEVR